MADDSSDNKELPAPRLVPPNTPKKGRRKPLPPSEQWNNFCEAMAEQELLEAGVFPDAKDAGDVHTELKKLERPFVEEEAERRRKALKIHRKPEQSR